MTTTTKTIFEHHQIRKTKKQKQAFRDYVESVAQQNGYSFHTEKGMFGSNNIIIGDPASAKVVYTAHYDTCPVLPFPNFITPLNFGIYLLYQFALIIPMFIALFLISFTLGFVALNAYKIRNLYYFRCYFLISILCIVKDFQPWECVINHV